MTGSVISLTTSYAMLGLLLLSLHLQSNWPWQVKAVAICTALPLFVATFVALQTMMGWPSEADLPETFQLHAALVEEPNAADDQAGAIFLWVSPADAAVDEAMTDADLGNGAEQSSIPRAFALPYSRELHNQVEAMRDAMQKGKMVAGRHHQGSPMQRRFGQQDGGIDLYAPRPPALPSKDG